MAPSDRDEIGGNINLIYQLNLLRQGINSIVNSGYILNAALILSAIRIYSFKGPISS